MLCFIKTKQGKRRLEKIHSWEFSCSQAMKYQKDEEWVSYGNGLREGDILTMRLEEN